MGTIPRSRMFAPFYRMFCCPTTSIIHSKGPWKREIEKKWKILQIALQKQQEKILQQFIVSSVSSPNFPIYYVCLVFEPNPPMFYTEAPLQVTPSKRMWRLRKISWRPCVQVEIRCQHWTSMACVCAFGFKHIQGCSEVGGVAGLLSRILRSC